MTPEHTVCLAHSLALPAVALAPSQKFYLADMLPKAPYLTRLDAYIYISFLTIVAIFVANCIVLVVQDYQQLTNTKEPCPSLSTTDDDGYCVYPSLLGEGDEEPTFAADFADKLLFFVIASVFFFANIYQAWKCYNDIKKMRYANATRVASEEDKTSFKEDPNPTGKCNTFTPFLFNPILHCAHRCSCVANGLHLFPPGCQQIHSSRGTENDSKWQGRRAPKRSRRRGSSLAWKRSTSAGRTTSICRNG